MEIQEGVVVRGRAEIDTRRPFKSVKEAVILFGEKVLAEEVYHGQKLKQAVIVKEENNHQYRTKVGAIAAELEETKQTLEKAKDEDKCMAYYLASLKQELEETKFELKQLKLRSEPCYAPFDKEIQEIKSTNKNHPEIEDGDHESDDDDYGFEKKRSVKFASPPSLTKVMVEAPKIQETSPSSLETKAQRKTKIPSFGRIFSLKKGTRSSRTSKSIE
ncbi:WEB family protein At3g51220-like [Rutidosis leptorrhynchoides]|uniref:WEB family protein At3g51220-like n=1 Tax=Rutidosis leptorrhynchoides TaxID=125765 RepID=UPI003A991D49